MTRRLALALLLLLAPAGAIALAKSKPIKKVKATVSLPDGGWTLRVGLADGKTLVRTGSARRAVVVIKGSKRPKSFKLDSGGCTVGKAQRKGRTLKLAVTCTRPQTAGPEPSATPEPTATPAPAPAPTATPVPGATSSAPRPVTPYVDMTLGAESNLPDLVEAKTQTGIPATTLGFITAMGDSCKGGWGGRDVTATTGAYATTLGNRLQAFRSAGGQIVLAFGGLSGFDLAQKCATVDATKAAYQQAIDAVGAQFGAPVTHIDLDVEDNAGHFSDDDTAIARQAKAIAALQAANPNLVVTYTVQSEPTRKHDDFSGGMMAAARKVVAGAVANGVSIGAVNAMAMDYGTYYSNGNEMGKDAISVAGTVRKSLGELLPSKTDAQLWHMIGITLMIGRNDITDEVTTPGDVDELVAFAKTKGLALVGMWSTSRDKPCPNGVDTSVAQPTCHSMTGGSVPATWTFGRALARFSS